MWKRFSVLAAVLLLRLSEVASRPVPDTPHQQFARSGVGDDDGWPRVEGGWHKGCTTSNRPKPTATPVTVYEEVTITQVATVTMTVDSTVVVTDYVDVTSVNQDPSVAAPSSYQPQSPTTTEQAEQSGWPSVAPPPEQRPPHVTYQPTSYLTPEGTVDPEPTAVSHETPSAIQSESNAMSEIPSPIMSGSNEISETPVPTSTVPEEAATSTSADISSRTGSESVSPVQPTGAADTPTSAALSPDIPTTETPTSEGPPPASTETPKNPTTSTPLSSGAVAPGGKKGLNYNDVNLLAKFPGIGWVANWEQTYDNVPQGVRGFPMLWNTAQQRVDRWQATVDAALKRGDNVLFSFNELQSDQCTAQACMTVDAAVAAWRQYMLPHKAKGAILISPSITQSDIGHTWLSEFIAKCPPAECKIDALSLHWYEQSHQIEYFKTYLTEAHKNAAFGNLPIYVSEWAPTDGDAAQRAAFIKSAVEWMDQQDFILGYALFSADDFAKLGMIDTIGPAYAAAA